MSFPQPVVYPQGTPTDAFYTYGPAVTTATVRAAVLQLLQDPVAGVVPYLAEIERQNNLQPGALDRPYSISSYRSGIDFESYESDHMPMIIVTVKPAAPPQMEGGQEVGQMFAIQVAAVVSATPSEEDALTQADAWGTAYAMSIIQHGGLALNADGTYLATNTRMTAFPESVFPSPVGPRSLVRCVGTFQTYIRPMFAGRYGPPLQQTPLAPGASVYPTVEQVDVTLSDVPLGSEIEQDPTTTEIT